MKNQNPIKWRLRIAKAIKECAKQCGFLSRLRDAQKVTFELEKILGPISKSRKNLTAIGRAFLRTGEVRIISPVCLDHAHNAGAEGLVDAHVGLITRIRDALQSAEIQCNVGAGLLIPSCDLNDEVLIKLSSPAQMQERIAMLELYALKYQSKYLKVRTFESGFPAWQATRRILEMAVSAEETLQARAKFISERHKLCKSFSLEDSGKRSRAMAADYLTLATLTYHQNAMVLTHTTPNVLWYKFIGVPVLHNPVGLNGNAI